jgi:hypothetical protein
VHDNILKSKVCFESKLSLIQWLDEENWIKSMCIKYIMYIFSTTIGLHICGSRHITKPKKNEKYKMPTYKIFAFFFEVMVFSQKQEFIMHLLLKKCKNFFFEWIFNQIFLTS